MSEFYYYIAYKPFGMISQFTPEGNHQTLKDLYNFPKDVYSVGRLDTDSEGLLIFTNDGFLKSRLMEPKFEHSKKYYVQVEGELDSKKAKELENGVSINLKGQLYKTLPAKAELLPASIEDRLPKRNPPVRDYKPRTWLKLQLKEGKNRQVRKMTAAIGFPTLRLIRFSIQNISIDGMQSGEVLEVSREWIYKNCDLKTPLASYYNNPAPKKEFKNKKGNYKRKRN